MKKSRFISLLLCVCMVMSLFVGVAESASADGDVIDYVVANGDYLFKVCQRMGLNYYQVKGAIMALNGFTSEQQLNRISVGQHIKLPATNAVAATVKSSTTTTVSTSTTVGGTTTTTTTTSSLSGNLGGYTVAYYLAPVVVKSGDTLNSICNSLGTSYPNFANVILRVNGLRNAGSLQAGQTVYIPTTTPFSSGSGYAVVAHSVASGENLTSICGQYGLNYQAATTKALVDGLNPNKNLNKIWSGDILYIPVSTSAVSSVVSTGAGSGSSGTGTAKSGYQIAIYAAEHGNPYAVVGSVEYATRAEAGKSVVIKTNPSAGYAVKSIKVIRTDSGSNVIVTNNAFTMPASNVQITVVYEQGLKIQKAPSTNGSFDALVYGAPGTSAFYGDEITIHPIPYSGYSVDTVYYVKTANPSQRGDVKADKSGVYKFNMPDYAITLYVTFKQTTYHKLNSFVVGQGSITFTVDGKAATQAVKGKTVTATITPAGNWTLNEVIGGINPNPRIDSPSGMTLKKINNTQYTFVVGDNDVTVWASFDNVTAYTLVRPTATGGMVAFNVTDRLTNKTSIDVGSAKAGDTVEIVYIPNKDYSVSAANITWTANHTTVASTGALLTSWTTTGRVFTMPDSAVSVLAQFTKDGTDYWALSPNNSGDGTFYFVQWVGGSHAATDPKVTRVPTTGSPQISVFVTPVANRVPVSVDVSIGGTTTTYTNKNISGNVYEFYQSASAGIPISGTASIKVNYELAYSTVPTTAAWDGGIAASNVTGENVTLTNASNGQHIAYNGLKNKYAGPVSGTWSDIDNSAAVIVGTNIKLNFKVKEGYEIVSVQKQGGSGIKVLLPDGGGNYFYQVTTEDYTRYTDTLTFQVTTKATGTIVGKKEYAVQYSPDAVGGTYTMDILDKETGSLFTGLTADYPSAHAGDEVTLRITANAGYTLDKVVKNGVDVNESDIKVISSTSFVYSFIVGEGNVTTQVVFKAVPTALKISGYTSSGSFEPDKPTQATAGKTVSVRVKPNTPGLIPDGISVKCASGDVSCSISTVKDSEGYYTLTFVMPEEEVTTVSVGFKTPALTYLPCSDTDFTWDTSNPAGKNVGTTVTVKYSISVGTNKEVKQVTGLDGIEYTINYDPVSGKGEITFVMPERDVTLDVSIVYKEQ